MEARAVSKLNRSARAWAMRSALCIGMVWMTAPAWAVTIDGGNTTVNMSENNIPVAFSLSPSASGAAGFNSLIWSISQQPGVGQGSAAITGTSGGINGSCSVGYTVPSSTFASPPDVTFKVQVEDPDFPPFFAGDTDEITVTVHVDPESPPVINIGGSAAGASTSVTMGEDGSSPAFSLALTGTDADSSDTAPFTPQNLNNLQWSISSAASNGTAGVSAATGSGISVTYSPTGDFNGSDSFDVRCTDSSGRTDTLTVNVTINSVADSPVIGGAATRTATISEDENPTAFTPVVLSAADVDTALGSLTWSVSVAAGHGTASVSTSGQPAGSASVDYSPTSGYNGSDTFTIQVTDGASTPDTVVFNITVDQEDAPVITEGASVSISVNEFGTPTPTQVTQTLNATDDHTLAASLAWTIQTAATNGAASLDTSTGGTVVATYAPNFLFNGSDSFVVRVTDGTGRTDDITVNVTVNDVAEAPIIKVGGVAAGASTTIAMDEDGSPTAFSHTLSATDTDTASSALTWSVTSPASNGTASISGQTVLTGASVPTLTYAPAANFNGSDSFTVQVQDGDSVTDSIVVNVTINAVNDPPVITEGASVSRTIDEDGFPAAFALTLNATDLDVPANTLTWSISVAAGHGTATASGTGASKAIIYNPTTNFNGSDSFTVQVSDGAAVDTIAVSVTINAQNDAPVFNTAATDLKLTAISEDESTPAAKSITAILGSGTLVPSPITDVDPAALKGIGITAVDNTHGSWEFSTNGTSFSALPALTVGNALLLRPADLLRFIPAANFNGAVPTAIQFIAWDQTAGTFGTVADVSSTGGITAFGADVGSASITVKPVNDPPTPQNDTVSVGEDSTGVCIDVLANDTDLEVNFVPGAGFTPALTQIITPPQHGAVGVVTSGGGGAPCPVGNIFYVPDANYNGSDSFTYLAVDAGDGSGNSPFSDKIGTVATVNITVTALNDPPLVVPDSAVVDAGQSVVIDVLSNDSDLEKVIGDPDLGIDRTTVSVTVPPANGSIVGIDSVTGAIEYSPGPSFGGTDTFTYRVFDKGLPLPAASSTAVVTVAVTKPSMVVDILADIDNNVTTLGDVSLREAFKLVATGGTVSFSPALFSGGQTILTLTNGPLVPLRSFTVQGPAGGAGALAISANNASRIITVGGSSALTINGVSFIQGRATAGNGGGFEIIANGALNLNNCIVSSCVATGAAANQGLGGAIHSDGAVTLRNCTLSGNTAAASGGAIYSTKTLNLFNCTLAENAATAANGGAIALAGTSVTSVVHCTIAYNSAVTGGGVGKEAGALSVKNSLIAGNTASGAGNDVSGDAIQSNGFNLVGDDSNGVGWAGTDLKDVDVVTVIEDTLHGNGGIVPTLALLADSPAIDAANAADVSGLGTDQRGGTFARIAGTAPDIGAYEVRHFRVDKIDDGAPRVTPPLNDLTLREAIAISLPGDNIAVNPLGDITLDPAQGNYVVSNGLAIHGPAGGAIALFGNNASSILYIPATEAQVVLSNLTFTSGYDSAGLNARGGSAIYSFGGVRATDCLFVYNKADGLDGGAIHSRGAMVLTRCRMWGNTAGNGAGAIVNWGGTLTLDQCDLTGNTAVQSAGALLNLLGGSVTLRETSLSDNTATSGGGIFNSNGCTLTVRRSTLSGNSAASDGGGIFNLGGMSLTNVTISGNDANRSGGGVYQSGNDGVIINCTVTDNGADLADNGIGDGGGIYVASGAIALRNTLVAENHDNFPPDPPANLHPIGNIHADVSGSVQTQGFNLIGIVSGALGIADGVNGDQAGTSTQPLDPRLAALADNGGKTLTHMLRVKSPAIDKGDVAAIVVPPFEGDPITDQRGATYLRLVDGDGEGSVLPDVGALEFVPVEPDVTSTPGLAATEDQPYSYTVTVDDTNLDDVFVITAPVLPGWLTLVQTANAEAELSGTPANGDVSPSFESEDYAVQILITDFEGKTRTQDFTITVTGVNDKPDAVDDTAATDEDTAVDILPLDNDSDVDGDLLPDGLSIEPGPAIGQLGPLNGQVAIDSATGIITYTPNLNFNGVDTFVYGITDNGRPLPGLISTATVTVTVGAVNDPPDTDDDAIVTDEDVPVVIDVLGNDGDVDGTLINASVVISAQPAKGTVSVDDVTGLITYTPNLNVNGPDTFDYQVTDTGSPDPQQVSTGTVDITITPINDPPAVQGESITIAEDTPTTVNVLANDSDVDGTLPPALVTIVTLPAHGLASVNPLTGAITYSPEADYNGTDSLVYSVTDDGSPLPVESTLGTIDFTINAVNDAPRTTGDTATTNEDTAVTVPALANDTDVDGNLVPGSVTVTVAPQHGTTSVDPATGDITYTPTLNSNGVDTFTYRVSDDGSPQPADSATALVTVTVTPINDAPAVTADAATTNEDTATTVAVLANDSDVDGNLVIASLVVTVPAAHGQTTVNNTTGTITYTPNPDYNGPDAFGYTIADDGSPTPALTSPGMVNITVTAINDAPAPLGDSAVTNEDNAVVIPVLANDTDVDGQLVPASVFIATPPAHGTAVVNAANGAVTYTPAADYNGTDSFVYEVTDNGLPLPAKTSMATAQITVDAVNDAPRMVNDTVTTLEDTAITVPVLANDTDVDGNLVVPSLRVTVAPRHGAAVVNTATGEITYRPDTNYNGPDSLEYAVTDDGAPTPALSATATLSITISAVNDPPAARPDFITTDEDVPAVIDVLGNDSDVDGSIVVTSVSVISVPSHGTAVVNPATGEITYTPAADYFGVDTFRYEITDNGSPLPARTAQTTVTMTMNSVNDTPRTTQDTATTDEDTPITVNVLANDKDVDGLLVPASVIVVTAPAHGQASVAPNGTIMYTPEADYNGDDVLTYTVSDDGAPLPALTSGPTPLTLHVTAVNDAPRLNGDTASTAEDTSIRIDVLANDADVDGNLAPASVAVIVPPLSGSVEIEPATGAVTYTPKKDFNGTDSFQYRVSDDGSPTPAALSIATASITVTAVNDAPKALDDTATTSEDTAITIDVLANDSDVDGQLVRGSVQIVSAPQHGTAVVNAATGAITFTPTANFNGVDRIEYEVSDNGSPTPALKSRAHVLIQVGAINDRLKPQDDAAATAEDTPVAIDVLANDSDTDGQLKPASVKVTSPPSHGSVSVDPATGAATYTPAENYNGPDQFRYTVSDDGTPLPSSFASATVSLTVSAVNDAPTATAPAQLDTVQDAQTPAAGVSVADVDYAETAGGKLEVMLTSAHGALHVDLATGANVQGGAIDSHSFTLRGSVSALNATLATLSYLGDSLYYGPDAIEVAVNDLGNSGAGGVLHAERAINIGLEPASMVVTTLDDLDDGDIRAGHVSLREAIAAVIEGGVITFDASLSGTLSLDPAQGALHIERGMTISGPGAEMLSINAGFASRVFLVDDGDPAQASDVRIAGLSIADGDAGSDAGGAILNMESLTLDTCRILASHARSGGGVYTESALYVVACIGAGNRADELGGFIAGGAQSDITVRSSTATQNKAAQGGGLATAGAGTLVNATFSGNSVSGDGGAVFYTGQPEVAALNCTFTGNTADDDSSGGGNGGAVFVLSGAHPLRLANSIVAGNMDLSPAPSAIHHDVSGSFDAAHNNIIGDITGSHGFAVPDIIFGGIGSKDIAEVLDANLIDNGGPTPTHALTPQGPAIDAGDDAVIATPDFDGPPFADQRGAGFARIVRDHVDIGAVELQAQSPLFTVNIALAPGQPAESAFLPARYDITFSEEVIGLQAGMLQNLGTSADPDWSLNNLGGGKFELVLSNPQPGSIVPFLPAGAIDDAWSVPNPPATGPSFTFTPALDSDGDGSPDAAEGAADSDGDGTPNYADEDSDNDGVPDEVEFAIGSDAFSVASPDIALVASPDAPSVDNGPGTVTVHLAHYGLADVSWQASLDDDAGWATITGAANGTNDGGITLSFTANASPAPRSAAIHVSAPGAFGYPRDIVVTQDGCDLPDVPVNAAATFDPAGSLDITWLASAGATGYQVYRGQADFATAQLLDTVTMNSYAISTASAILLTCNPFSDDPRGYTYWVVAVNACGSSAEIEVDGDFKKRIAEEALPSAKSDIADRSANADDVLAVRLSADDDIDPASVWGAVEVNGDESDAVSWSPIPGSTNDGWAVAAPGAAWPAGSVVWFTAGAQTVSGAAVGPITISFEIAGDDKSAEDTAPTLKGGIGEAYRVGGDAPFATAQRVLLPLPVGVRADAVALYYLHAAGGAWYDAADVAGWLVPGSASVETIDGVDYIAVLANHGGIVQLGAAHDGEQGAGVAPGGGASGDLLMLANMLVVLLISAGVTIRRHRKPATAA